MPVNASLTTSYAPALTPPVVITRSACSVRLRRVSRNTSTSSLVIGATVASAPASRTAAASITAFDS